MVTRGEKHAEGKFAHPAHPKDGYPLSECKDPRAKRLLEFLVPIFYLEEPARVTATRANTILEAYTSEQDVDWALVMRDTVRRLLTRIGKSKPTPICLYSLHLYVAHNAIQTEDKKIYLVAESFIKHNVEPDEEEQPKGPEDSEYETLSSKEIRELQEQQKKKQPSPPMHKLTPIGKKKEKTTQEEERPKESKKRGPFKTIMDALQEIREHFGHTWSIVRAACAMVGVDDQDHFLEALEELPYKQTVLDL